MTIKSIIIIKISHGKYLKQKFTINGYSYSVNNAVLFSPFSSEEIGLDTMQHPIFPIHHTFFFS